MAIRPIDIQILLGQMTQVSKDQAAEKEGAALQASIQNLALQKRKDESKEAITGAEDAQNATRPVNDRRGRGQEQAKPGKGEEAESEEGPSEEGRTSVVRDPNLGNNIDLSG